MKKKLLRSAVCLCLAIITLVAPLGASAASVAKIARISGSDVRLRSSSGYVMDKLSRGEKVLCTGSRRGSNYQVITTDGQYGYVYKAYLSEVGSINKSQLYMTRSKATLYRASGKTLKKNGTLAKNQFVLVYKTNGDWVYAKTMAGKYVYMKKSDLKKVF